MHTIILLNQRVAKEVNGTMVILPSINPKPLPWYYYPLVIIASIGSALGLAP